MPDNSDIHHRRSIRLQHYDYASLGGYFVTICSHERQCLFGEISDGEMHLNAWGRIIRDEWLRTPAMRSNVELDEYVIMPNHFHGVILIGDVNIDDGAHISAPLQTIGRVLYGRTASAPEEGASVQPMRRKSSSLGSIIAGFKSAVTRHINELCKTPGAPVWHRNYYEHVIRNEKDLGLVREYIVNNPQKWDEDENNPQKMVP